MSKTIRVAGWGILWLCSSPAFAQTTEMASVATSGALGDNWSHVGGISADGRFVAFKSYASNLVPGDTNGGWDVFVRDRVVGITMRASVDSNGIEGDDWSGTQGLALSADGRFVVFGSYATNLVPGDQNGTEDVFVHDLLTGATTRVSVDSSGAEGDDYSLGGSISADGQWVAFVSAATNLVPGDTNGCYGCEDVFVHDLLTGATTRASVASSGAEANAGSGHAWITPDGRYVSFTSSADNLAEGDTNGVADAFVHDLLTGSTERVSVGAGGAQGNARSWNCGTSSDGRFALFYSDASNLVPGDSNGMQDVFVHDRQTGVTTRVSVNSSGVQLNYQPDLEARISGDGRFIVFSSLATNVFPGNWYSYLHTFLHDRLNATTVQVDICWNNAMPNMGTTYGTEISADGQHVGFSSYGSDLVPGDTNGQVDAFVRDFLPASATAFCLGDGTGAPCPCGNSGGSLRGCQNSASTGGAVLLATGVTSLASDTLRIACHGERNTALSVFMQGDASIGPTSYGDGLLCLGGTLKRLFVRNAGLGIVAVPQGSDPTVSARSAALGDPIPTGATRYYQVYYRDPASTFCPAPLGSTFNVSNALSAVWDP
jgi:hypothetical protein